MCTKFFSTTYCEPILPNESGITLKAKIDITMADSIYSKLKNILIIKSENPYRRIDKANEVIYKKHIRFLRYS